ncbi:hypothetical protein GCM10009530_17290 [Microbispora corallina]|uniref:Uncharacterized protein n=1 Tax=Microbispora corallina TaxID=83302 RepID=A0ABQ4FXZ6_9ACTN|nr:hypothetical protein Mco01_26880 [Microbispora corallina]
MAVPTAMIRVLMLYLGWGDRRASGRRTHDRQGGARPYRTRAGARPRRPRRLLNRFGWAGAGTSGIPADAVLRGVASPGRDG